MADFVKVGKTGDVPPGTGKTFQVGSTPVAVFNVGGVFHAVDDTCPHMGGPLGDEGMLNGEVVTCGWHGWRFNVKTGVSPVVPSAQVNVYPVKVEGDDLYVAV